MNEADFSDAVLVVLGHGTELNEKSSAPVFQHVAELRSRRLFREVREAFWKQEPQIKSVLAALSAPRVFIAPLLISEGYFASEVIPQKLGFNYPDRLRLKTQHSELLYCRPIGSHAGMTKVILSRAVTITRLFPFPRLPKPEETTLFIAGHGTEKNAGSRQVIEWQAELIRAQGLYASVQPVFMEEEPRIAGCHVLAPTKKCVVVPFFISDGLHVVEDIPVLLGESERIVKIRLAAFQPPWRNPTEIHGKLFWYSASVGTEPSLADVILERVAEAAKMQDGK